MFVWRPTVMCAIGLQPHHLPSQKPAAAEELTSDMCFDTNFDTRSTGLAVAV